MSVIFTGSTYVRVLRKGRKQFTTPERAHEALDRAFLSDHSADYGDVEQLDNGNWSWYIGQEVKP